MLSFFPSSKIFLFSYFVLLILLGSVFLVIPQSWKGEGGIAYIDALFTAASAVCVTGLITVNTAFFSPFGQTVIMVLIQFGGLGIITFSTIYLTSSGRRISFTRRKIIKDYYLDSIEYDPKKIIKNILLLTLTVEIAGALILFRGMYRMGTERPFFTAAFHAVSAFCNAGFSLFPNSLEGLNDRPGILLPVIFLLMIGGIGFVVIQDLVRKITSRRAKISLHTKIVLLTTGSLILIGFIFIFIFERQRSMQDYSAGEQVLASLLQAVTPRTAGFNSVAQSELSAPSRILTMVFMFVGGAPGSIAGGVKVTTFALILAVTLKGVDNEGNILILKRRVSKKLIFRTHSLILKAVLLLCLSIFLLTVSELYLGNRESTLVEVVFESFSAFGTVGLSMGITPGLTGFGKIIIILTMFTGRVGIIVLAIGSPGRNVRKDLQYPYEEVLIG